MSESHGRTVFEVAQHLSDFAAAIPKDLTSDEIANDIRRELAARYTALREHLVKLGCVATTQRLDELKSRADVGFWPADELNRHIDTLMPAFRAEFDKAYLLILSGDEILFHDGKLPNAGDIAFFFEAAIYDYREAGRCFAARCYTASVFHIVRCLEVVLTTFHTHLQLPQRRAEDRSWGHYLNDIRKELVRLSTGGIAPKLPQYDAIFDALETMRNPLRNATMHVERTFTASEAGGLFELLMRILDAASHAFHDVPPPPREP